MYVAVSLDVMRRQKGIFQDGKECGCLFIWRKSSKGFTPDYGPCRIRSGCLLELFQPKYFSGVIEKLFVEETINIVWNIVTYRDCFLGIRQRHSRNPTASLGCFVFFC